MSDAGSPRRGGGDGDGGDDDGNKISSPGSNTTHADMPESQSTAADKCAGIPGIVYY